MKSIYSIFFILFFFTGVAVAQDAGFRTEVSSNEVAENEAFRIQFTISNASKISGFTPPEFKGFDQLQSSQNQSMRIINGDVTREISYVYVLRPTAVGNFVIEGATARVDGNSMKSNPVNITVTQGQAGNQQPQNTRPRSPNPFNRSTPSRRPRSSISSRPAIIQEGEDPMDKIKKNVFAKVNVDKKEVYVGEQFVADYKLYTRLPTSSQVTKVPSFSGFSTHDLPIPNPPTPKNVEVDGEQYRAFTIRKTILFPLQTGEQTLDPVNIENDVRLYTIDQSDRGGRNPFDDFFDDSFFKDAFDDPFFRDAFGGGEQLVPHEYNYALSSPTVSIKVKPLPEEGKPDNFDGAVGSFNITSSIDENQITTDGAITLTVKLSGDGNIDLLDAPHIDFPNTLEAYDPKVSDQFKKTNPFGGSRTFTYVLMPKATGEITIPAISYAYFDPQAEEYKTIQTKSHSIQVTQGEKPPQAASENSPIHHNTLRPLFTESMTWNTVAPLWFGTWIHWLFILFPILLLISLLYWKRQHDALLSNQVLFKNKKANKVALRRLKLAGKFLKKDSSEPFYEEVSQSIWGYLSDKLSIPRADLSKQKALDHLAEKQIPEKLSEDLFTLLDRCEMALYAKVSGHEYMEETYQEAVRIISHLEDQLKKQK